MTPRGSLSVRNSARKTDRRTDTHADILLEPAAAYSIRNILIKQTGRERNQARGKGGKIRPRETPRRVEKKVGYRK